MNKKYSYNGYDPKSQTIKDEKAALLKLLKDKKIDYKEYSKRLSSMKRGWKYQSLLTVDPAELSNSEIIGTAFAQREPFTDTFPVGMTGVTFTRCNLGNCNIPPGNILNNSMNEHYKSQKDEQDWIVDVGLRPVSPLSPAIFDKYGLSKDPKDIPATDTPIVENAEKLVKEDERKAHILAVTSDPVEFQKYLDEGKAL